MIITGAPAAEFVDYRITAKPEDYDGYPLFQQLILEAQPHKVSPELVAVAAVLAFRPYISTLSLDQPISPTCAQAIEKYLGFASSRVQPITLTAAAFFEPGHKELRVVCAEPDGPPSESVDASQLVLELTDRAVSFGHAASGSNFQVATNVHSLMRHVTSDRDRIGLALACGVILAPSMGCRGLCATGSRDENLISLVNSTGLTMRFLD